MAKQADQSEYPEKLAEGGSTRRRAYWEVEINKACKRWGHFHRKGALVQDRYRLEKDNAEQTDVWQDRYNILYSSVETTTPSLYAQTPKVEAVKRHKDRDNEVVNNATMVLEAIGQYAVEEVDFDGVLKSVVQDYMLPGIGVAWVRYEPKIGTREGQEYVAGERVEVDWVYFKDFITGVGRTWLTLPWVARRVYLNRQKAEKRFGKEKASKLSYSYRPMDTEDGSERNPDSVGDWQAIVWEIWDKDRRKVVWYSQEYPSDILDEKDDPLKLENFWPCPEPLRAVWTTRTFTPKSFYSQYKAQAEELDNITKRIRYLTQALRVIGVYDASMQSISQLLNGEANKMVPVENWAQFAGQGGIKGVIDYVPIKEVAEVLRELYTQREIAKNEIYEITGFSDIVRGVSKASETLGAQKLKADWAGGRLKHMQKDVQRFCRDLIRIMTEIMSEQFSDTTIALYAGFEPPEVTPEEQAAAGQYAMAQAAYQQNAQQMLVQPGSVQPMQPPPPPPPTARQLAIKQFQQVIDLLRNEKRRCALIGIETDSTIMPDEAAEREDRMAFLAAAGAFLQQAAPMAMQFPDMRALIGALMMFTIRTFRASRPLEKVFEETMRKMEALPPTPPPGQEGGGSDPAAAQAQVQSEQMKQQTEQAKIQAQQVTDQAKVQIEKYRIDIEAEIQREKMAREHEIKVRELALREREVAVKEAELSIARQEADNELAIKMAEQSHQQEMDEREATRQDAQFSADQDNTERQFEADEAARESESEKQT